MGGMWPCSSCFVSLCFQDLFKTAHSIIVNFSSNFILQILQRPRGIVANVLDCDILVSEFELQSYRCVYYRINTYEKHELGCPLAMD